MKLLILTLALAGCSFATTAYPVPPPNIQFFDTSSGVALPCVNCTVSTFAAGTSTPTKTYTDSTATTQNPVVITLNSAGYTTSGIWLAGTCYKFILANASASTIWSQDNVCAASGPTGATGGTGTTGATGATGAVGPAGVAGAAVYTAGTLVSANFNTTSDQEIAISFPTGYTKMIIRHIFVDNCSIPITTAVGGIYLSTAKGGGAIVAATQTYSALTNMQWWADLQLTGLASAGGAAPGAGWWYGSGSNLWLSLTTAQGVTATCDVSVVADWLP